MPKQQASALAHPNIAFIKYWGNRDPKLRLPANSSLSMNLRGLETRTSVRFDSGLKADSLVLNGEEQSREASQRVSDFLDIVRSKASINTFAAVESENNFPSGAGIASSASAFAALALAASRAAGLSLAEEELSRLARRGSGSASRSVPGSFVEWQAGQGEDDSYAFSIANADYWDLVDHVAILDRSHKSTSSTEGHALADSSPLQKGRVEDAERRLEHCRRALLERDFGSFAEIVELDSNMMHAVMMTSSPPLIYWRPATLKVMTAVQAWRAEGLAACYTIDAGPNVHVICEAADADEVLERLKNIAGVEDVLTATPGGPAHLLD